ncbi:unnamed protein product [Closterium sp. Naga37s-1]|nr:unnamed protein product [Closterium sp. Naga37s-1]
MVPPSAIPESTQNSAPAGEYTNAELLLTMLLLQQQQRNGSLVGAAGSSLAQAAIPPATAATAGANGRVTAGRDGGGGGVSGAQATVLTENNDATYNRPAAALHGGGGGGTGGSSGSVALHPFDVMLGMDGQDRSGGAGAGGAARAGPPAAAAAAAETAAAAAADMATGASQVDGTVSDAAVTRLLLEWIAMQDTNATGTGPGNPPLQFPHRLSHHPLPQNTIRSASSPLSPSFPPPPAPFAPATVLPLGSPRVPLPTPPPAPQGNAGGTSATGAMGVGTPEGAGAGSAGAGEAMTFEAAAQQLFLATAPVALGGRRGGWADEGGAGAAGASAGARVVSAGAGVQAAGAGEAMTFEAAAQQLFLATAPAALGGRRGGWTDEGGAAAARASGVGGVLPCASVALVQEAAAGDDADGGDAAADVDADGVDFGVGDGVDRTGCAAKAEGEEEQRGKERNLESSNGPGEGNHRGQALLQMIEDMEQQQQQHGAQDWDHSGAPSSPFKQVRVHSQAHSQVHSQVDSQVQPSRNKASLPTQARRTPDLSARLKGLLGVITTSSPPSGQCRAATSAAGGGMADAVRERVAGGMVSGDPADPIAAGMVPGTCVGAGSKAGLGIGSARGPVVDVAAGTHGAGQAAEAGSTAEGGEDAYMEGQEGGMGDVNVTARGGASFASSTAAGGTIGGGFFGANASLGFQRDFGYERWKEQVGVLLEGSGRDGGKQQQEQHRSLKPDVSGLLPRMVDGGKERHLWSQLSALAEALTTDDSVRWRHFMRQVRREAAAGGDTLQRIAFHALQALRARTDGTAIQQFNSGRACSAEGIMELMGHDSAYSVPSFMEYNYAAQVQEITRAFIDTETGTRAGSGIGSGSGATSSGKAGRSSQGRSESEQREGARIFWRQGISSAVGSTLASPSAAAAGGAAGGGGVAAAAAAPSSSPSPASSATPLGSRPTSTKLVAPTTAPTTPLGSPAAPPFSCAPTGTAASPPAAPSPAGDANTGTSTRGWERPYPSAPTPLLKITAVDFSTVKLSSQRSGMVHLGGRYLEQVARMLDLPFTFQGVETAPEDFHPSMVEVEEGEEVVVLGKWSLHLFPDDSVLRSNPRNAILKWIFDLSPLLFLHVDLDADANGPFFLPRFQNAARNFAAIVESLDTNLPHSAGPWQACEAFLAHDMVNSIACEGTHRWLRTERLEQWRKRMEAAGFRPKPLHAETVSAMRAVTEGRDRRFELKVDERWFGASAELRWRGTPTVFVAAWH